MSCTSLFVTYKTRGSECPRRDNRLHIRFHIPIPLSRLFSLARYSAQQAFFRASHSLFLTAYSPASSAGISFSKVSSADIMWSSIDASIIWFLLILKLRTEGQRNVALPCPSVQSAINLSHSVNIPCHPVLSGARSGELPFFPPVPFPVGVPGVLPNDPGLSPGCVPVPS